MKNFKCIIRDRKLQKRIDIAYYNEKRGFTNNILQCLIMFSILTTSIVCTHMYTNSVILSLVMSIFSLFVSGALFESVKQDNIVNFNSVEEVKEFINKNIKGE